MRPPTLREIVGVFVVAYGATTLALDFLLEYEKRHARVDGVTAASWENGFYTKNRTDLPFGTRAKLSQGEIRALQAIYDRNHSNVRVFLDGKEV